MQETQLIAALKKRDENAFKWLVESYHNRLYNTAFNLLQDAKNAEDALQDTFIKVYESINNFREDAALHTWVHRILIRICFDKIRQQKIKKTLISWLPSWVMQEKTTDFNHPGIRIENKEIAKVLFNAIKTLPENQRIAFTLIKIENMRYEEACKIMVLSSKAVESLVSRAKQNLQKKLELIRIQ